MKKYGKRLIGIMLSVSLCIGGIPVYAFPAQDILQEKMTEEARLTDRYVYGTGSVSANK